MSREVRNSWFGFTQWYPDLKQLIHYHHLIRTASSTMNRAIFLAFLYDREAHCISTREKRTVSHTSSQYNMNPNMAFVYSPALFINTIAMQLNNLQKIAFSTLQPSHQATNFLAQRTSSRWFPPKIHPPAWHTAQLVSNSTSLPIDLARLAI